LTKGKEIIEIVDGPHRLLNTAVTPIEPYAVEIPYEPLEGISHREQMVTLMATAFGVYSIDWLRKKIESDPDDDEPAAGSGYPALVTLDVFEALNAAEGIGNRRSNKSWL